MATADEETSCDASLPLCKPHSCGGIFLPLFGEAEQEWNEGMRAVLYMAGLLLMFMGVNVVSDFFMNAIEVITSQKRRVKGQDGRYKTVFVWNDSVKNLTLLALGSSAPEILLSCIELFKDNAYSGKLGPSTIVGSAAFNLLVIVSVCIASPTGLDVSAIKTMPVYHVTVIFSILAYVWLLVIVVAISKDVIDVWEAFTLLMFPLLVVVSFFADKGYLDILSCEPVADVAEVSHHLDLEDHPQQTGEPHHAHPVHPRLSLMHHRLHHNPKEHVPAPATHTKTGVPSGGEELEVLCVGDPAGCDKGGLIHDGSGRPIQSSAGIFTFRADAHVVCCGDKKKDLKVEVLRLNGKTGTVKCKYRTEGLTAVPGQDFSNISDELVCEDGVDKQEVTLEILPKRLWEPSDEFQLILEEPTTGLLFNPNDDGGEEQAILTVTIKNENSRPPKGFGELFWASIERWINVDNIHMGAKAWQQQIFEAVSLEEPEDDNADEAGNFEDSPLNPGSSSPGIMDYVVHVLSLPWKVLFAVVSPPAVWCNGWCLFFAALIYIALCTAFILDFAQLFGCCTGIAEEVTAITIVALGTSLPDMFASISAARQDDSADASIVNVTGSNSVNVFLGIGLPWTFAAFYWRSAGATEEWKARYAVYPEIINGYPDGAFVVRAGSLSFSVQVFNCVAIACLVILRIRRNLYGGELGGPPVPKACSSLFLLLLWAIYIGTNIWKSLAEDDAGGPVIVGVLCGMTGSVTALGIFVELRTRLQPPEVRPPTSGINDQSTVQPEAIGSPSVSCNSEVQEPSSPPLAASSVTSDEMQDQEKMPLEERELPTTTPQVVTPESDLASGMAPRIPRATRSTRQSQAAQSHAQLAQRGEAEADSPAARSQLRQTVEERTGQDNSPSAPKPRTKSKRAHPTPTEQGDREATVATIADGPRKKEKESPPVDAAVKGKKKKKEGESGVASSQSANSDKKKEKKDNKPKPRRVESATDLAEHDHSAPKHP